jgi:hypothetical protein
VFLLCNAHDDAPVLFQSRFALSYLRGPLTRPQIQALSGARAPERTGAAAASPGSVPAGRAAAAPAAPAVPSVPTAASSPSRPVPRPVLPPDVPEAFARVRGDAAGRPLEYRPTILGTARLHYVDARRGLDAWETVAAWAPFPAPTALEPWEGATLLVGKTPDLDAGPVEGAAFAPLPPAGLRAKSYAGFAKALEDWLYRTRSLAGHASPALGEVSRPGESEGDFRVRLAQKMRERRDAEVEALRRRFRPKLVAAEDRVRAAQARLEREKAQATQAKLSSGISFGAAILGAIFGGRRVGSAGNVGRAGTAARGMGRAAQQAQDVGRAEEGLDVLVKRRDDLQREIEAEVARLEATTDPQGLVLEPVEVAPRKGDLTVGAVSLVWAPHLVAPDGSAEPAS